MPVVNYLKKVQLPNNTEYTVKDPTFFTGTTEEWNLLSIEEKQSYQIVNLTDDEEEGDISGKADKVTNAVDGNFAGLDNNGNLTDSTWSADKTTQSASGNPISITGLKSNQLAINPIITLEPIQAGSGTPSPSNVRAISGYDKVEVLSCGKNLFDKSEVVLGGLDTTTGEETSSTTTYRSGWMCVKPNTTYIISGVSILRPFYYGKGKVFIERSSTATGSEFTTPNECNFVRFQIGTSVWETATNAQLEEGSTITTYVPYNKATSITESIGQTVYGGSLDLRSGKLTVDRAIVDLGDLAWTRGNNSGSWPNYFLYAQISDMHSSNTNVDDIVCSIYAKQIGGTTSTANDKSIITRNNNYIYVRDDSYTDADVFKTAVTGQKLAYELATPFTIQLTPHEISLLKDYAYVSTNGTSMSFNYHNGEMASLSDVAQLSQSIEAEKNILPKKLFEQDIISYNSSTNKYQVPMDGYVTVSLPGSVTGFVRIIVYDAFDAQLAIFRQYTVSNSDQYYSLFVKKGMRIQVSASSAITSGVIFRGMA